MASASEPGVIAGGAGALPGARRRCEAGKRTHGRATRTCLALLAATALLALAAPAQAQTEVWSATLTPVNIGGSGILGCLDVPFAQCSITAILSDDDFTHDSTDYTVFGLILETDGSFSFAVDTIITTETAALTLVVGSTSLVLADATTTNNLDRTWASSGVSLTAGTDITVKLTAPGTPNTAATGAPTITGTAQVGQTLTASTTGIADADGLTSVSYAYQWIRVNGTEADIAAANSSTYLLVAADLGTTIKVKVSFTDDASNSETLTSAATATVGAAATGPPTVTDVAVTSTPASGTTYYLAGEDIEFTVTFSAPVTVTGTPTFAFRLGAATRQAAYARGSDSAALVFARTVQAGEVDSNGISWNAIALALDGGTITQTGATTAARLTHAAQASLEGHRVDAAPPMQVSASVQGLALVLVYDEPLDPASLPATGAYTVTATGGATTTTPAVSEVSIYGIWVTLTLDAAPAAGATVTLAYAPPASNPVQDEAGNDAPAFSGQTVNGAAGNTLATGAPTITGTAQVGQTLTAGTTAIMDADGLTSVSYTYQWIRVATDNTETNISSAAASTYMLVAADQGTTVKVTVSFTDDANNPETLTSAATATVSAAPNTPATGAPTITGTAQVGQTLTAGTTAIMDADGLTSVSYTYQWIRVATDNTETNISSAAASTYMLVAADQGTTVKVTVSFTDDANNPETLTSAATATVSAAANTLATGAPTITGTAQVGQTLTAGTTAIMDADGLTSVSYTYQWIRVATDNTETNISSAAASTYMLVAADQGTTVKVTVSFTDDANNPETLTSAATATVSAAANTLATGAPTITGTAQVGQTLTAGTTAIMDADGLTSVSYTYQWIRVATDNTETNISSAPASTYTLVAADQGTTVKVTVSFTDDANNPETLTSAATAAVSAAANTLATGAPTITGTAQVGQTLTASTTGIADANGLTSPTYTYQWIRVDGTDEADIAAANSSTYILGAADLGTTLTVRVTFADDLGHTETLTSAATATVGAGAVATAPTVTDVAVTSTPASGTTYYLAGEDIEFTVTFSAPVTVTGTPTFAFRLGAATRQAAYARGSDSAALVFARTVQAGEVDSNGISWNAIALALDGGTITQTGATTAARLTHAAQASLEGHRVDAAPPMQVSASVQGLALVLVYDEPLDPASLPATGAYTVTATGEATTTTPAVSEVSIYGIWVTLTLDAAPAAGATVTLAYAPPASNPVQDEAGNDAPAFSGQTVNGAAGNTLATGAPTITGTAQVGQTLTAGTTAIMDADGLTSVSYTYQWIRVATDNTETNISSAAASTYMLVAADQGTTVKVTVSFTDDANNPETLTSAATATVSAAPNTPATGAPTITGTAQVGQTLTAGTTAIMDADGLTSVSYTYQWIRVATDNTETNISSAAASTYMLVAADQGTTVKVTVSFTDDANNPETLTSAATATVSAAANTLATGAPTITGTAQVGQTLTAGTTAIMDADGLTSVSYTYQWIRVATDNTETNISSAAASTYMLVAADQGTTVKVTVSFTDDANNPETLTSAATATVSAAANTLATGAPTITGTAQVGQTLTAGTTAIMDADGLTSVSYTYQWIRVATDNTETNISSATASTYTLVAADQGTTVKVTVSFTDDANNPETLTSAATAAVSAAANTLATGAPTITGTAQVGQTLTASTTGIADANGLTSPTYTYQWIRVDGTDEADIAAANSSTYILGAADLGTTLKVRVTFADDLGYTETLTSAATATVGAGAVATAPTVTDVAVTSTPRSGTTYYLAGEVIEFTVTFSAPVTVTGTPTFAFRLGAATRQAAYARGSDSAALVFARTVQAGEVDSNGISWNAIALALDGGTITQTGATTAARLTHAAQASLEGHRVDAAPPMQVSASVQGLALVLVYDEPLDPASLPATGAYTVTATGGATTTTPAVSEVSIYGIWVTLTLDAAPAAGATVTLAYAPPASNPVQDEAGNDAPAFSGQSVRLGQPPPPPVTDLAQVLVGVAPGNAQLVVTWTAVDTATGYTVQWTSGGQGYNTGDRQATVTPGSTTSHTIEGLANGTEYTVRVIATRTDANDGPPSAEVTGTTEMIPVPTPTLPEIALLLLAMLLLGSGVYLLRGRQSGGLTHA